MRKCLPLTTLNQELVENATLSESVREELLINETEHKMIYGSPPRQWATPGSPGLRESFDRFAAAYGVNFSELEYRLLGSLYPNNISKAVLNVPRGIGKTTFMQHSMRKLAELGRLPPFVITDAEVSRVFPSAGWERQTLKSAPKDIGSYAVRDAVATAKHLLDQHKLPVRRADYGDEVCAERAMQKNRRFVLNFDQLGGGK